MRYLRVIAKPFGPFRHKPLELAPGMNVIHGPNEAGKSTLHSALYVGLCGIRRTQGPPTREDREFAERHRPWNGEGGDWKVGALIQLECGRRIELHHDLAAKAGTAIDADIPGSDFSGQLVYDGAVDGSRWLGLNRRSFKAIACVRQADMLGVKESAGFLQDALEKAVATAPADASVASALTGLKEYRGQHVGTLRAPTKPLCQAIEKARKTRAGLETAREERRQYREFQARVEDLQRTAEKREQAVKAKKAVQAENAANAAEGDLHRASQLETRISRAPEPPSAEDDELATEIRLVRDHWAARPKLVGSSADQIKSKLDTERRQVTAARGVLAEREAEKVERRLARASELEAQFPNGPPQPPVQDEQLATNVIEALVLWKNRPRPVELEGPSVEEIDRELETVLRRRTAARAVVAERESERWERRLIRATRARWIGFLSFLLLLAGAAAATVSWAYVPGTALALLWGGWMQWRLRRLRDQATEKSKRTDDLVHAADDSSLGWARQTDMSSVDLDAFDNRCASRLAALGRERDTRANAETRWHEMQRDIEAARRGLVGAAARIGIQGQDGAHLFAELDRWQRERTKRTSEAMERRELWRELQALLDGQSVNDLEREASRKRQEAKALLGDPILESTDTLQAEFRAKAPEELTGLEQESGARHGRLEEQLRLRRQEETRVAERQTELTRVGHKAGVSADTPERLVSRLGRWLSAHAERTREEDEANNARDQRNKLVGERSLDDLAEEARQLRQEAEDLARNVEEAALAQARAGKHDDTDLERLQQRASDAAADWQRERGRLLELRDNLLDVADAEDSLAEAEREVRRVKRLGETLDRTIKYIESAQERVFRTIAPTLRTTLLEWLPEVTKGRYTDCRINPETLDVSVRADKAEAPWQNATLLSHGTAEQVYLLLRLALSRHLVKQGERCPLILDDPVASSDASRKRSVLEVLHAISESVQVILFTHDQDVRAWASARLSGNRHHVIDLKTARG
ncbi:MAG: AAA family ATPase [Gammaproteobacteria bacterium]|nr:AAA family ATPase [Gammaproteobacteria bacterium]